MSSLPSLEWQDSSQPAALTSPSAALRPCMQSCWPLLASWLGACGRRGIDGRRRWQQPHRGQAQAVPARTSWTWRLGGCSRRPRCSRAARRRIWTARRHPPATCLQQQARSRPRQTGSRAWQTCGPRLCRARRPRLLSMAHRLPQPARQACKRMIAHFMPGRSGRAGGQVGCHRRRPARHQVPLCRIRRPPDCSTSPAGVAPAGRQARLPPPLAWTDGRSTFRRSPWSARWARGAQGRCGGHTCAGSFGVIRCCSCLCSQACRFTAPVCTCCVPPNSAAGHHPCLMPHSFASHQPRRCTLVH